MQQPTTPDRAAVVHILLSPRIAERTAPYIGPDGIDFAGLELETASMSGGETLLVRLARDLWTGERTVGILDLVHRLDNGNFARVIEALEIARGAFVWEVVDRLVSPERERHLAA